MRFVSTTVRHCSTVSSSSGTPGAPTPALLNSRSRRPKRSATSSNSASTDAGSVTSPAMATAPLPAWPAVSSNGPRRRPASDDGEPRLRECDRGGAADAAAGPGDDCDRGHPAGSGSAAAELVVDVDAHDVVEGALGDEAQGRRSAGVECRRPAGDDARRSSHPVGDGRGVRHRRRRSVAARPLLGDGRRHARHREAAPVAEGAGVERRRMEEEAGGGARRGEPVANVVGHRQHRLAAVRAARG